MQNEALKLRFALFGEPSKIFQTRSNLGRGINLSISHCAHVRELRRRGGIGLLTYSSSSRFSLNMFYIYIWLIIKSYSKPLSSDNPVSNCSYHAESNDKKNNCENHRSLCFSLVWVTLNLNFLNFLIVSGHFGEKVPSFTWSVRNTIHTYRLTSCALDWDPKLKGVDVLEARSLKIILTSTLSY